MYVGNQRNETTQILEEENKGQYCVDISNYPHEAASILRNS
jgi:hypothetical protein